MYRGVSKGSGGECPGVDGLGGRSGPCLRLSGMHFQVHLEGLEVLGWRGPGDRKPGPANDGILGGKDKPNDIVCQGGRENFIHCVSRGADPAPRGSALRGFMAVESWGLDEERGGCVHPGSWIRRAKGHPGCPEGAGARVGRRESRLSGQRHEGLQGMDLGGDRSEVGTREPILRTVVVPPAEGKRQMADKGLQALLRGVRGRSRLQGRKKKILHVTSFQLLPGPSNHIPK